jgi:hypothetical protein
MYMLSLMEHKLKRNLRSLGLLRTPPLFPLLLGKNWIEKDQIRRKVEEEAKKNIKKELRDFIARRIH